MVAVRVVVNRAGMRALFAEPGVLADLERRGRAVRAVAGEGMRMEVEPGAPGRRPRVAVITDTWQARRNEAKTRALTRAVDAARG